MCIIIINNVEQNVGHNNKGIWSKWYMADQTRIMENMIASTFLVRWMVLKNSYCGGKTRVLEVVYI